MHLHKSTVSAGAEKHGTLSYLPRVRVKPRGSGRTNQQLLKGIPLRFAEMRAPKHQAGGGAGGFQFRESNLRTEPAGIFPFRAEGLLRNLGPYFFVAGIGGEPGHGAVAINFRSCATLATKRLQANIKN